MPPRTRDVLGTAVLAILSGHQLYAHISGLRGDTIYPPLLGMEKVVSEDAVRRGLRKVDEQQGAAWMPTHLDAVTAPLLSEPWIRDTDVTVKPLDGHQEGAVVGYNSHQPGRPSHSYHTYFIATPRLVLDVEVQPGHRTASKYSASGLWELLERLGRSRWPVFIRPVDGAVRRQRRHCRAPRARPSPDPRAGPTVDAAISPPAGA